MEALEPDSTHLSEFVTKTNHSAFLSTPSLSPHLIIYIITLLYHGPPIPGTHSPLPVHSTTPKSRGKRVPSLHATTRWSTIPRKYTRDTTDGIRVSGTHNDVWVDQNTRWEGVSRGGRRMGKGMYRSDYAWCAEILAEKPSLTPSLIVIASRRAILDHGEISRDIYSNCDSRMADELQVL